ncbi:MAG: class II SORL domain-containing protein [archaeon]
MDSEYKHKEAPGNEKHLPVAELPKRISAGKEFEVRVNVGSVPHPMEGAHHIEWVSLWFGGKEIAKKGFKVPPDTVAEAVFRIKLSKSGSLAARESCNIHGKWEAIYSVDVF